MKFAYFGSSHISVVALNSLVERGFSPSLIITSPDKPKGRKLVLTSPEIKDWADKNKIPVIQPPSLKDPSIFDFLSKEKFDLFVVVSYGKIIPKNILEIPPLGTLNLHPSLLPKLRGPSPLQYQILNDDRDAGVSIMKIDEEVDHGPLLIQERVTFDNWPPKYSELEDVLGKKGGELLAKVIPEYEIGKIVPKEQNHSEATFTKKIIKEDGLLDLSADPYQNFLKIQAFETSPGTYFFLKHGEKEIRLIVRGAEFRDGQLHITRVVPEGKKEMDYQDFLRGI